MPARPHRVLLPREEIAARVEALAGEIAAAWAQKDGDPEVTLVPVMTGAFVFAADLIRHLPRPMRVHPVRARSYPGAATTSQGVTLDPAGADVPADLAGRHVLVVDDILDSGRTLAALRADLLGRGAACVSTCVLLRKPGACRDAAAGEGGRDADFVAFDVPDAFVVGYGLDHDGRFRNLPDVEVLDAGGGARAAAADARVPAAGGAE